MEVAVLIGLIAVLLGTFGVRSRRSRSLAPLVEALRGIVAGAAAGVLWGIGARAAMRAVALAAGDPTNFTLGGTAMILVAGAILGALLGLIFAAVRGRLPASGASQGLIAASSLLALFLVPFALFGPLDAGREDLVGVGSFGALLVAFGTALGAIMAWLDRRLLPDRSAGRPQAAAAENGAEIRLSAPGSVL